MLINSDTDTYDNAHYLDLWPVQMLHLRSERHTCKKKQWWALLQWTLSVSSLRWLWQGKIKVPSIHGKAKAWMEMPTMHEERKQLAKRLVVAWSFLFLMCWATEDEVDTPLCDFTRRISQATLELSETLCRCVWRFSFTSKKKHQHCH